MLQKYGVDLESPIYKITNVTYIIGDVNKQYLVILILWGKNG